MNISDEIGKGVRDNISRDEEKSQYNRNEGVKRTRKGSRFNGPKFTLSLMKGVSELKSTPFSAQRR